MCPDCHAARETIGRWVYFDPKCLYCGSRLIQRIAKVGKTDVEITQRRRVVLADWMAQGHDEQALRDLVKGPMAVQPINKKH